MKKKFMIDGLDCASCAAKMERALQKIDGVKEATVNFMTQKLVIDGENEKMDTILQEAEKAVRGVLPNVVMKKS